MRPPRPEMSDTTPPPVLLTRSPTGTVRLAGWLWFSSVALGLAAVVLRVLDREGQLSYLQETAAEVDATIPAADLETVALIAFWGTVGALLIVFLSEAILVRPFRLGLGWTRWVLTVLLVVNLGATLLASAFLTDDSGTLQPTPVLLSVQALLAVAALILSFLPTSSRWFRDVRTAPGVDPS
ncbi:hypothetical protein E8P82_03215 [Arthrobacter echini]|uniref:DUF2569 domain-containing protein n=1 Tax=Arthrobacter echini TaxID=1529066 RepID=A0A4S5E878_9MICC|nr:hypothetical protein [Arthrobacter echini]THJ67857.1 hypothetical protein E8P82_03215 [Arthrobacter echini]